MKQFLILSAFLSAVAAPASAQSVSASVPDSVMFALRNAGLQPELILRQDAPPVVQATLEGVAFGVFFNNCTDRIACEDLQLRATFRAVNIDADMLNTWNRETFVGKAYLSDEDTVALEHAMVGVDGMSRYTFRRTLVGWNAALKGFRETFSQPK